MTQFNKAANTTNPHPSARCPASCPTTTGWDKQKAEEKIRGIYNNLAISNSDVGNIVNVIGGNHMFGDISSNKHH